MPAMFQPNQKQPDENLRLPIPNESLGEDGQVKTYTFTM